MEKYSPHKKCIAMSRDEARAFDDWAINSIGIPGMVLMENAGRSCAEFVIEELAAVRKPKVCIFCGTGNNGGDGFVITRHLFNSGIDVRTVVCGQQDKIAGDAKINLDILSRIGCVIEQLNPDDADIEQKIESYTDGADMIIDALFGTGLSRPLTNGYCRLIEKINKLNKTILAVDVPSGLDCNTGEPLGTAIKADYTITFIALKKGFKFPQAQDYTGEIFISSIGVAARLKGVFL
jgi:NAD(P)H-hydrate epimerase